VEKGPESSHGRDATDQAYRDGGQHFPAFASKRNNTADEHRHREAPKIHSTVHQEQVKVGKAVVVSEELKPRPNPPFRKCVAQLH